MQIQKFYNKLGNTISPQEEIKCETTLIDGTVSATFGARPDTLSWSLNEEETGIDEYTEDVQSGEFFELIWTLDVAVVKAFNGISGLEFEFTPA